jgi:hypothetical protein
LRITANAIPAVPSLPYSEARKLIRTGDLLFCSGDGTFSRLIKAFTNSIWTHVGFIWRPTDLQEARCLVMESVEGIGVRMVPLSSYANNYNGSGDRYNGVVMIARHEDFRPEMIHGLTGKAIDLLGHPYDQAEIVRISLKIATFNALKRYELPDDNSKYICSEYAGECFDECGITFNSSCGYRTPADMATTEKVRSICTIA